MVAGLEVSEFKPSDVRIYRPYSDEVPWELLADAGVADDVLADVLDLNFLRVAKHEGKVAGTYGIRPVQPTCYELVTLIVVPGYRRCGLGRWLLGHAIGLAETKGGREIITARPRDRAAERFLTGQGFAAVAAEPRPAEPRPAEPRPAEPAPVMLRLVLTPE